MASEKITKLLEEIKTLSVMELFELEKGIEEEFRRSLLSRLFVSSQVSA